MFFFVIHPTTRHKRKSIIQPSGAQVPCSPQTLRRMRVRPMTPPRKTRQSRHSKSDLDAGSPSAPMPAIIKQSWKPGNVLAPVPVVLVSCGGTEQYRPNLVTIAWTGNVCSEPPMLSIAVRPERHSHKIIGATGEFVVNLPSGRQAKVTDWCGMVSGARVDKFSESGLTAAPALKVGCPIVLECPINIECRVSQTLQLGSHDLFLAEVLAVQVSSHLIDVKGKFRLDRDGMLAYGLGHYYALGRAIDHFGFSIRKKKSATPAIRRRPPAGG
jgi:flavin reductase (DIM6/NTAB) family NADH-FMN oxidoreductase RutF